MNLRAKVCNLDKSGNVIEAFAEDILGMPYQIVVVPDYASNEGFTPGNLYITFIRSIAGINSSILVEFTPEGKFVRKITGGNDFFSRLTSTHSLAFTPHGSLLAAGHGLLEFTAGGSVIRRLSPDNSMHVAVNSEGVIYQQLHSGLGTSIKVLEKDGTLTGLFPPTEPGESYGSMAFTSTGVMAVVLRLANQCYIQLYTSEGSYLNRFSISGIVEHPEECFHHIQIAAWEHIFVPSPLDWDIKVFTLDGTLLRRIDLKGALIPIGITLSSDGGMCVCGLRP